MANERLRAAMIELGLTHLALAEELGVNVKTVQRWSWVTTPAAARTTTAVRRTGRGAAHS